MLQSFTPHQIHLTEVHTYQVNTDKSGSFGKSKFVAEVDKKRRYPKSRYCHIQWKAQLKDETLPTVSIDKRAMEYLPKKFGPW